jgi:F0F1-type ATP synthase alpha subunit
LDDVPTPRVSESESGFYAFLERERPQVLQEIAKEQALTDSAAKGLDDAVDAFRKGFLA